MIRGSGTPATEKEQGEPDGAPGPSFASLLAGPALIWGWCAAADGAQLTEDLDSLAREGFHWLHLNLADQRTHRWLADPPAFPPPIGELLTSRDGHPRVIVEDGIVGLVLQDFERGLDAAGTADIGALHIVVGPQSIVTGRYHPIRSADVLRQKLARRGALDPAEALTLLLDSMTGLFAADAREMDLEVQTCEDELLNDNPSSVAREMVSIRRRSARLHRLVGGMRTVLHRFANDPEAPDGLRSVAEGFAQRVDAIESDIVAAQGQLRMLRDEIDLQAAQRTNSTLYFLSMMSALLLPATLVTGFFGMNTGGLPLAHGWAGTLAAGIIALLASASAWMLLRRRDRS
ncbi:MAG TPA: CorA family divalent cation transporter [Allosphingosinicella sp.]|nr:CorA family divalent cation transporter [Allosphingosinicella sp.]